MSLSCDKESLKAGRSRFAKNTALQYGLQIAKYIFPFLTIPYLTRVLGPDVYAVRAYVLALMSMMLMLLEYGFNAYGTKVIAEQRESRAEVQIIMTVITLLRLCLCMLGFIILLVVSHEIILLRDNLAYVLIAYLGTAFKALLPDFIFQGFEEMGIITRRYVLSQAVALVLIFSLVRTPDDLILVAVFETVASCIALLWSWGNVIFHRGLRPARIPGDRVGRVFKTSTAFFLSNAATTMFTSLTTLMIGVLVKDVDEISFWSISMMAISAIQSLYTPISNSLYPHVVIRRDFSLVKKLLVVGVPVCAVGTIAYACLSNYVMLILGGPEYLKGSYIVALTAPVLFLSFPAMLIGIPVLAAIGEVKKLTASSVISACFHVLGLFLLAAFNQFTIVHVAVLRCLTEFVLLLSRGIFVFVCARNGRLGDSA